MSTGSFFDEQHDDQQITPPLYYRLLRRWEVQRADVADGLLPGGDALLDIGCGDGELARRAAARYRRVVATDISSHVVARARDGAARNIEWMIVDASGRLPFADGSFDGIVSLSTLQYLFDPEAFLREAARLLRPGGQLVIETPNVAYLPQRLRLLLGLPIRTSFWKHGIDGGNLHYFTVETLGELVRGAGFVIQKLTGSGVLAPLRTWRVSLLCGNIFVAAEKTR